MADLILKDGFGRVPWPVWDEWYRRRRNAAWGWAARPVAPTAPPRTPPARVLVIEAEWYAAFLAHPDNRAA